MSFRFREEPLTQHLLVGGLIAGAVGLGSTVAFADAWAGLVGAFSDRVLLVGGLMVLHTVVFYGIAGAFDMVDRTDWPHFIAKHRTQPDKRKMPDMATTLRVLFRNQFLILPVLLLGFGELLIRVHGWTAEAALPSFGRLAYELVVMGICALVVFYSGHRFLHQKWWMKKVHRVHHEFRATTAWASEYAHPFEFVVGNFGALAAGALVVGPHLASMYLFSLVSLVTILVHHSGYALPWAPWSVHHDWHHYRMKEAFGTTGLLDRLLGTHPEYASLHDGDVK